MVVEPHYALDSMCERKPMSLWRRGYQVEEVVNCGARIVDNEPVDSGSDSKKLGIKNGDNP